MKERRDVIAELIVLVAINWVASARWRGLWNTGSWSPCPPVRGIRDRTAVTMIRIALKIGTAEFQTWMETQ